MEYSDKECTKTNNYLRIIGHLKNIIEKHKPERIIMEGISYGSVSGSSLVDLAGINFLIRSLCIQYGRPYTIVSPTSLKKFVCANGQADKEVIIDSWKRMDLNINDIKDIKIDDLADAFFLCNYTV
jgi:Holliday junction resolvasome RuvABC endonuclease subunit